MIPTVTRRGAWAQTLNLPQSPLSNRSNRKRVAEYIRRTGDELYRWQRDARRDQDAWVLHDGPPYANGALHMGHALNKILKDVANRYHVQAGRRVEYVPGWDCHGLPIELASLKKKHRGDMGPLERRKLARDLALRMIEQQKEGFRSFGVMADWDSQIYTTLETPYVVRQLRLFARLHERGLVFRQRKPVYWSVESGTALAEAELEYGERTDTAAFLKYPLVELPARNQSTSESDSTLTAGLLQARYLSVWTTTPWTLVANQAIAINPGIEYNVLDDGLVVASGLKDRVAPGSTIIGSFLGSELLGSHYRCPLTDRVLPVVAGDHVTAEAGTGLVHTAPGHGKEDWTVGLRENLPALSPVDARGRYTPDVVPSELAGLDARKEGSSRILELLGEHLIRTEAITHSVPLDWRSQTPVMVRATPQFFIELGATVRARALEALDKVEFRPESGRQRLRAFVSGRTDWCISRQRVWGVPIPAFFHVETGEMLLNSDVVEYVIDRISTEGVDAWFAPGVEGWLPSRYKTEDWVKCSDTMDVWLDSGTSWAQYPEDHLPVDLYLEGSDQHRGWFQSSLLTRVAAAPDPCLAVAPFKRLVTHGFVLDKNAQKMSKSRGNVVSPDDLVRGELGVDGLRLLLAAGDYTGDIAMSDTAVRQAAATLKKLRLTFRFLLANTATEPETAPVLSDVDKWALSKLKVLVSEAKVAYENQNLAHVLKLLLRNMNSDLSSVYFDAAKDALYADKSTNPRRIAIQHVLWHVLSAYVRVLSPLVPLLTQEVWDLCPASMTHGLASPGMAGWPELLKADEPSVGFERILALRPLVNEAMEQARAAKHVGSSLACDVYVDAPTFTNIEKYAELLPMLFIASRVVLGSVESSPDHAWIYTVERDGVKVSVVPPLYHKCPRCWVYASKVEDELCDRCSTAVA